MEEKISKSFRPSLSPSSMANASLLLLLIAASISVAHLLHGRVQADPRASIVHQTCDNAKATASDGKTYESNYRAVLKAMEPQMRKSKWSWSNNGEPPNQAFVLAACMDDLSPDDCAACFRLIGTVAAVCFPSVGARVYFEGCFIRVDNYSFGYEVFSHQDTSKCSDVMDENYGFKDVAKLAIRNVVKNAPHFEGYAHEHQYNRDGASVYAMAKCWGSLAFDSCSACLEDAEIASDICLPAADCWILNSGCVLRYSNKQFTNASFMDAFEGIIIHLIYIFSAVTVCTVAVILGLCLGKLTYDSQVKDVDASTELTIAEMSVRMHCMRFKYSTLEKATESFSEARKLGSGGSGEVFKGTLQDRREIAIKRLFMTGKRNVEEIQNEMEIISKAQHKHLVRFIGCCFTDENGFLVYEYLPNNSLDFVIFDEERKKVLDWPKRLGIIVGTAKGLKYLHTDCEECIFHRDIKASNVLLDIKYKPKIADFGLARLSSDENNSIPVSTPIAGTLGYMAPEYIARGRLTEKVDVYSFGVLVLEIVCGIRNSAFQPEDQSLETLVTAVWKMFKADRVADVVDQSLGVEDMDEIKRMVHVGLLCTQESPSSRPTMTTVVKMLNEKDCELPMPTKPPFTNESMELSFQFSIKRDNQ